MGIHNRLQMYWYILPILDQHESVYPDRCRQSGVNQIAKVVNSNPMRNPLTYHSPYCHRTVPTCATCTYAKLHTWALDRSRAGNSSEIRCAFTGKAATILFTRPSVLARIGFARISSHCERRQTLSNHAYESMHDSM